MQTNIPQSILDTPQGKEANDILRSCVHCGFCTATCPTYQALGDELDGPRGRIYLIKEMLEGGEVTERTQQHLDRCLTCRACETTCPSGVEFAHLAEIGKAMVEEKVQRPFKQRLLRSALVKVLPSRTLFSTLLGLGRLFRPVLPLELKQKIPKSKKTVGFPKKEHLRKVLLIEGCVQPAMSPEIDVAAAHVLDKLGIQTLRLLQAQCCGAVENHLNAKDAALKRVRLNIDLWMPFVELGVEAILSTASACALEIKEYGHLLKDDPEYAENAKIISDKAKDIVQVLSEEDLSQFKLTQTKRIAFHAPCTLQHGQQLNGSVESILTGLGYELMPVADAHLCCGSSGTYSILQPKLSQTLRDNKLMNLMQHKPQIIATANIGCLHHLAAGANVEIVHWVTLLNTEG
ncbi:glycolate oxidase subunit GlcF [Ghiorsea bivora]|uniref:glycolate oxidase subunit GlcF n=1 Tax=Ghiorsea bivora TaxID=1485545 RepID=UPI0005710573|nr:glycolate oxidase subunit GlcF [Ghiorsea bivora]